MHRAVMVAVLWPGQQIGLKLIVQNVAERAAGNRYTLILTFVVAGTTYDTLIQRTNQSLR